MGPSGTVHRAAFDCAACHPIGRALAMKGGGTSLSLQPITKNVTTPGEVRPSSWGCRLRGL